MRLQESNAISYRYVRDVGPYRGDRAGTLLSVGDGELSRIQPRSEVRVDEVDAGRLYLHDRLAGSGHRLGGLFVSQHLGAAGFVNANRLHPA